MLGEPAKKHVCVWSVLHFYSTPRVHASLSYSAGTIYGSWFMKYVEMYSKMAEGSYHLH